MTEQEKIYHFETVILTNWANLYKKWFIQFPHCGSFFYSRILTSNLPLQFFTFQFSRKLSQLDLSFLTVVVRARIGYSGGIFWEDSLMRTEGPHDKRKTPKLKIGKYSIRFFLCSGTIYFETVNLVKFYIISDAISAFL